MDFNNIFFKKGMRFVVEEEEEAKHLIAVDFEKQELGFVPSSCDLIEDVGKCMWVKFNKCKKI